jgi:hypothetical protein
VYRPASLNFAQNISVCAGNAGIWERIARVALPRSILLLLLIVSGMPPQAGQTRQTLRLQCPMCFKSESFGSDTALRQHRGALLAGTGESACGADRRMPLVTCWNGHGPRAVGTGLGPVLISGHESDDSDSQGDMDHHHDGQGGHGPHWQSPVHGGSPSQPPVDLLAVPPADAPADGGVPRPGGTYIRIHTHLVYIYMQIHVDILIYILI